MSSCDPFVERKLSHLLESNGFEEVHSQVNLSSYGSADSGAYLQAFKNLWRIFSSQGPEFFGLNSDSDTWNHAKADTENCHAGNVLTEGYFIATARKKTT